MRQPRSNPSRVSKPAPRTALLKLAAAAILGACIALASSAFLRPAATARASASPDERIPKTQPAAPLPPWGELVQFDITIERPDEYLDLNTLTPAVTQWFFDSRTREDVAALLSSTGLDAATATRLTADHALRLVPGGAVITPDADLVLGLAPATREKLYAVLAHSERNPLYRHPISFPAGSFDAVCSNCQVSPQTLTLVKSLLYTRGKATCFSDLAEVLSRVPSREEQRRVCKTLSRQAAVMLKVRVRPNTDVESLVQYWGKGARAKDIRPLLESLTRLPEGATIDVAHLMTRFSRKLLYTYPAPPRGDKDIASDCHWTTMNFFNDPPDDRFLSKEYCGQALHTDYARVTGERTFGDVIVLVDAAGNAVHSAVYIANDVVFTKNGSTHVQPWTLMKLADLLAVYPSDTPLQVATCRSRKLLSPGGLVQPAPNISRSSAGPSNLTTMVTR